jgi:hypothetical protein
MTRAVVAKQSFRPLRHDELHHGAAGYDNPDVVAPPPGGNGTVWRIAFGGG